MRKEAPTTTTAVARDQIARQWIRLWMRLLERNAQRRRWKRYVTITRTGKLIIDPRFYFESPTARAQMAACRRIMESQHE